MNIKTIKTKEGKTFLLYMEETTDDYLFNHQLSLVENSKDSEDALLLQKYSSLPQSALVSDRTCLFKSLSVKVNR